MNRIDLHVHTKASDGSCSTEEVVELAKAEGLKAVAITDHDTMQGIPRGPADGIEIIPGIEFSTKFKTKVHILGYFIDPDNAALKAAARSMVDDRDERNEKIVKLMRSDGIKISYPEMKERFGSVVGRPHFAEIMLEQGVVSSLNEAFKSYLEKGNKYWVGRTTLSLETCITLITGAGGVAVLAHPFEYKYELNSLPELIEECMKYGVRGLECRHSSHSPGQMAYLERLAEEYGLAKTGGSDFHGEMKPDVRIGTGKGLVCVPYSWLDSLRQKC